MKSLYELLSENDETKNKIVQDGDLTSDLKEVGLVLRQSLGTPQL